MHAPAPPSVICPSRSLQSTRWRGRSSRPIRVDGSMSWRDWVRSGDGSPARRPRLRRDALVAGDGTAGALVDLRIVRAVPVPSSADVRHRGVVGGGDGDRGPAAGPRRPRRSGHLARMGGWNCQRVPVGAPRAARDLPDPMARPTATRPRAKGHLTPAIWISVREAHALRSLWGRMFAPIAVRRRSGRRR
jgi:hypothetical protein